MPSTANSHPGGYPLKNDPARTIRQCQGLFLVSVVVSVGFSKSCADLRYGYSKCTRRGTTGTRMNIGDFRIAARWFRMFRGSAKDFSKSTWMDYQSAALTPPRWCHCGVGSFRTLTQFDATRCRSQFRKVSDFQLVTLGRILEQSFEWPYQGCGLQWRQTVAILFVGGFILVQNGSDSLWLTV